MFGITFKPLAIGLVIGLLIGLPVGYYLIRTQFVDSTSPKEHYPLYNKILQIKDRVQIKITEPNFTNPNRFCEWYELREEDSGDYFQTTVNF